jgi:hypothetical protein
MHLHPRSYLFDLGILKNKLMIGQHSFQIHELQFQERNVKYTYNLLITYKVLKTRVANLLKEFFELIEKQWHKKILTNS